MVRKVSRPVRESGYYPAGAEFDPNAPCILSRRGAILSFSLYVGITIESILLLLFILSLY